MFLFTTVHLNSPKLIDLFLQNSTAICLLQIAPLNDNWAYQRLVIHFYRTSASHSLTSDISSHWVVAENHWECWIRLHISIVTSINLYPWQTEFKTAMRNVIVVVFKFSYDKYMLAFSPFLFTVLFYCIASLCFLNVASFWHDFFLILVCLYCMVLVCLYFFSLYLTCILFPQHLCDEIYSFSLVYHEMSCIWPNSI